MACKSAEVWIYLNIFKLCLLEIKFIFSINFTSYTEGILVEGRKLF